MCYPRALGCAEPIVALGVTPSQARIPGLIGSSAAAFLRQSLSVQLIPRTAEVPVVNDITRRFVGSRYLLLTCISRLHGAWTPFTRSLRA